MGDKQIGRQTKLIPKTRYHFLVENATYDWLDRQANARGVSIAVVLNELLRQLRTVPHGIKTP